LEPEQRYGDELQRLCACRAGEGDRARECIEHALLIEPDTVNRRYNFACALVTFLDDKELALELLGPGVARMGSAFLNYTETDPDLDSLRLDPRFVGMIDAARHRLELTSGAALAHPD
jgi:adenylate cyclase